jgi:hypothetical protein
MKIIAESQEEFEELIRTFKYMHDFTVWNKKFNFKFWQWISCKSVFTWEGYWLDQNNYPLLGSLIHYYRIKHAHLEGESGIEESEYLKKHFYIEGNK